MFAARTVASWTDIMSSSTSDSGTTSGSIGSESSKNDSNVDVKQIIAAAKLCIQDPKCREDLRAALTAESQKHILKALLAQYKQHTRRDRRGDMSPCSGRSKSDCQSPCVRVSASSRARAHCRAPPGGADYDYPNP